MSRHSRGGSATARYELCQHQALTEGSPWEKVNRWQWNGIPLGVWMSGAPVRWRQGIDGKGCVVGVIDTGVDASHQDLQICPDGRPKFLGERDYVRDGVKPADYHWHGTHVAGTIAANGQVKGMAPGAQLRSYRVLGANGGEDAWLVHAIRDGVADGCHILNLSLGSREYSREVHAAIQEAVKANVVVVVAAGNDGPGSLNYPAYLPEVISVGAIGIFGNGRIKWQWFSTSNDQVDVCANGIDVLSTVPGGLYKLSLGTSMAAPHVAGQMALNWQALSPGGPVLETVQWFSLKHLQTVDVESAGIDARTGMGYCTFYPALPLRRQVQVTTNRKERVVDGVVQPLDVAPVLLNERTYTPTRHTHEALDDHVAWTELAKEDGNVIGTTTISRWTIPGMEAGQPIGQI